MALMGIDVGTTHLKAAAFSQDGNPLALATLPTPTVRLSGGGAEYDPGQIWQGIVACIRQVLAQLDGEPVEAIGVASMAEAGLLIDRSGRPLCNAIAWFDPRTAPQSRRLEGRRAELYRRTGQVLQPKWGLLKLLWLRENQPHLFAAADGWLGMMDWVLFRLCGVRVTEPTLAVRSMAFEITRGCWDEDLLCELSIPPALMPRLIPTGGFAGEVLPAAAAETGLPAGVPVASAGHDHPCAAVATGVLYAGGLLDSTGTAEALIGAGDRLDLGARALATGLSYTLLPGGAPALIGGMSASGGAVEWFRREVAGAIGYDEFTALAARAGDGPTGIAFLPHLAGGGPPDVNPASRAAWVGLTYGHGLGDMAQALLEGTVCEVRRMMEAMEGVLHTRFPEVVLTGGGARNPLWLQIRADLLGRPVRVAPFEEATLLGAALLGGVGAGILPDLKSATVNAAAGGRLIEPNPEASQRYDQFYRKVYQPLGAALRPVYDALAELNEPPA